MGGLISPFSFVLLFIEMGVPSAKVPPFAKKLTSFTPVAAAAASPLVFWAVSAAIAATGVELSTILKLRPAVIAALSFLFMWSSFPDLLLRDHFTKEDI